MSDKLTERQLNVLIAESAIPNRERTELGKWITRGDGVAVYKYHGDGPHPRIKFISYGVSRWTKIRKSYPPHLMPPNLGIGGWTDYHLVGYYRIG